MDLLLKGIIPPMITPLTDDGDLDEKGLEKLIVHLLSGGVHGIFILGTNGEGPSLTYPLRKEMITKTCNLVNHKVPVLVGITDTSLEGSISIAKQAKYAGADAVVVAPPYYFPISQNEMITYLESLIPKLPLPFVIYNMPSCTKLHLSLATVKKAKKLGAIGIKDSSGDINYLNILINEFKNSPNFSIIAGTESFLPKTIASGGHGAVAGGANIFPSLFVNLYEACIAGDKKTISILHDKVLKLYDTIYNVGHSPSKVTIGIKTALSVIGICNDYLAHPLRKFNNDQRKEIEKYIERINFADAEA